jgi:hypothetical protein
LTWLVRHTGDFSKCPVFRCSRSSTVSDEEIISVMKAR